MGELPARKPSAEFGLGDDIPVYWVSFIDAEAFCRAADGTRAARRRAAGGLGVPAADRSAVGVRLPRRHGDRDLVRRAVRPAPGELQGQPLERRPGGPAGLRATPVGTLSRQRVGHLRHARQHLRVVPRLVPHAAAGRHRSGPVRDQGRAQPGRDLLARPARRRLERRGWACRSALRLRTSPNGTPTTSVSGSSWSRRSVDQKWNRRTGGHEVFGILSSH